jgi:hypothetical protein
MAQTSARTLTKSLDKLQISSQKKSEPVESWEDEAEEERSDDTETDSGVATPIRPVPSSDIPGAPPPTPASPSFSLGKNPYQTFPPYGFSASEDQSETTKSNNRDDARRPEKSTAVASRLIAAGIGQKAPRRTKEQRDYDQAVKMQEKKKRDQAKADEERKKVEKEKARKAVWDD